MSEDYRAILTDFI